MYGRSFFVYILTNKKNGVLYIGMTNSLIRRIHQHKSKEKEGFSKRYNLTKLVYYEIIDDAGSAIIREKQMQAWKRQWKIELIEKENPEWRDLYEDILKS